MQARFSMSRFLIALCLAVAGAAALDTVKTLDVPEPVMDFILGCERSLRGGPKLPVATMEFDPITGDSLEQVNLLDFSKLRNSLGESIDNQELVDSIFTHIQRALSAPPQALAGRSGCMNIKVETPAVDPSPPPPPPPSLPSTGGITKYDLQEVVQNNNYILLESFNRIFEHQIRRLYTKIETLVRDNGEGESQLPTLLRAEDFSLDISEILGTTKPPKSTAPLVRKEAPAKLAEEEPPQFKKPSIETPPNPFRRQPIGRRPPILKSEPESEAPSEDAAQVAPEGERPQQANQRRRQRLQGGLRKRLRTFRPRNQDQS